MIPFVKTMSADGCRAEVTGWHAIRNHLPTPRLLAYHPARHRHPAGRHAVEFEDVFASGRCAHLLGDCIGLADHGLTDTTSVENLVGEVCADLLHCVRRTGRHAPLTDCVPALYLDRLRPGGRLDTWYSPDRAFVIEETVLSRTDLAATDLIIDDAVHRLDLPALLRDVRAVLHPSSRWTTAITQGDPTEPNIAYPRMWLDFEHAGRNPLAGDVANLLWYLLGMGGWLVPTYQPAVYQRTLRLHLPAVTVPRLHHLSVGPQSLRTALDWNVGTGRAAALRTLLEALGGELGDACVAGQPNLTAALRPFLVCRILGVINLHELSSADRLLCLAALAKLTADGVGLSDIVAAITIQQPQLYADERR
jgi:hypothetical protein